MALPKHLQNAFAPDEVEFIAGNTKITIEPLVRLPEIDLMCGTFGPFIPPRKVQVPLWLAVQMKKRHHCNIDPPKWLTTENLRKCIQAEKDEETFSALPYHYMEISKMLLEVAEDNIRDVNTVKYLLKDLREQRQEKARKGLEYLNISNLEVDNLSFMEINEILPFIASAMDELRKMEDIRKDSENQSQYTVTQESGQATGDWELDVE
ncbi:DNA replication complex GINS protein psf2 [Paraphysoderma sedebokerense]|nr:DNA replication complex GINS protein psf2 [Paraphysoderma sedebokerense]